MAMLFAFTVLVPASADAQRRRGPRGPTKGKIALFCIIQDAEVELNGRVVGKTPLPGPLELDPGNYTVRVFKRGFTEFVETVTVTAGEMAELEADLIAFAGIVQINANVDGATVAVDGKLLGRVPFDKDVAAGKHEITVQAAGYTAYVQQVDVIAGKPLVLNVELVPTPEAPPVVVEDGIHKKWWFWTIIGAVVVAGATTGLVLGLQTNETDYEPGNYLGGWDLP